MSLVITGHKGFVGNYLLGQPAIAGLDDIAGAPVDLLDLSALLEALTRLKPTAVLHMAAQSAVPEAFRDPVTTYNVNFIGTQNLLSALKATGFSGRFLYVSSAEVYGSTAESELPVSEQAATAPLNPYAVSKLAAEMLCHYYSRVEGMDVVIARPFNHIGPGQSTRFAIADFAKSIAEIRLGKREPVLYVGDLDVTRDFTDVRDVVRAYHLLLEKGQSGHVYNICSGIEQNMAAAVRALAQLAGVEISVIIDPARVRKSSQRRSCGDNSRLKKHTGWQPSISWRQSLTDILNDWESQLT